MLLPMLLPVGRLAAPAPAYLPDKRLPHVMLTHTHTHTHTAENVTHVRLIPPAGTSTTPASQGRLEVLINGK